jgi:RNA polymerase sigma-70 factor (ECF subfamily)
VQDVHALEFEGVYDRFFHDVERWLRAMGAPPAEVEDLAQEVFVVVSRKLGTFDGRNLPGWLYRIASLTARRFRRRPWYKHLFSRRSEIDADTFAWVGSGPAETVERREAQEELSRVLLRMTEKRRTAFILFELEGYSGEEIAAMLEVPVATVWTRLYHARQEFAALADALRRGMDG